MRRSCGLLMLSMLLSGGAVAADSGGMPAATETDTAPILIIEKPTADDLAIGSHEPDAPTLQSISIRTNVDRGLVTVDVVPDFHFIAPDGNAVVLRRELIETDGEVGQTQIRNGTINIPAEAQKRGAVLSGGWRCGMAQYYVTMRAYIIDADGKRSNAIRYTIHCNGG